MKPQPSNPPEHRAYQEAGHAVMSFLIRNGFTDKCIPISRQDILPHFKQVTIEREHVDWAETTSNLGSMMTVAQVLIAGHLAEIIKYNQAGEISARKSRLVKLARDLIRGYVEEYMTDEFFKKRKLIAKYQKELYAYVEESLRTHWTCVDILANALLQHRTLTEEKVFQIIAKEIPEDLKAKAETNQNRPIQEKLVEILKARKDREKSIGHLDKKSPWWTFRRK